MAYVVMRDGVFTGERGVKLQAVLARTFREAVKVCRALCSTEVSDCAASLKHRHLEAVHQRGASDVHLPAWVVVDGKTGAVAARITPTFWEIDAGIVYADAAYTEPVGTWSGVRFTLKTEVLDNRSAQKAGG